MITIATVHLQIGKKDEVRLHSDTKSWKTMVKCPQSIKEKSNLEFYTQTKYHSSVRQIYNSQTYQHSENGLSLRKLMKDVLQNEGLNQYMWFNK